MNPNSQLDYQFKVLLIGDSGVGKTSIMNRFTSNQFNPEQKSTMGVEYSKKTILIDNVSVQALIWDTAGQERFRSVSKNYYKGAVGAFLVFDVTMQNSFENILNVWISEVKQNGSEKIKMILIGNKADLVEQRTVKKDQAFNFAVENGLAYLETSALNSQNIDQAFETLLKEIYEDQDFRPKSLTKFKEHSNSIFQPTPAVQNFQIDDKKTQAQKKKQCCN